MMNVNRVSVGRAKDWKSLCPWFDSRWHHWKESYRNVTLFFLSKYAVIGITSKSMCLSPKYCELCKKDMETQELSAFVNYQYRVCPQRTASSFSGDAYGQGITFCKTAFRYVGPSSRRASPIGSTLIIRRPLSLLLDMPSCVRSLYLWC